MNVSNEYLTNYNMRNDGVRIVTASNEQIDVTLLVPKKDETNLNRLSFSLITRAQIRYRFIKCGPTSIALTWAGLSAIMWQKSILID